MTEALDLFLPRFSPEAFHLCNAFIDKFTISYENILFYMPHYAERENLTEYVAHLGESNFFAAVNGYNSAHFKVRHNRLAVSSNIIKPKRTSDSSSFRRYKLRMLIRSNLTKLIEDNALPIERFNQASFIKLFNRRKRLSQNYFQKSRYSFDGNTNYFTESGFNLAQNNIPQFLDSGINKIGEKLFDSLQVVDDIAVCRWENLFAGNNDCYVVADLNKAKIFDLEVAWDVYFEDALVFMRSIEASVFRFSNRTRYKVREDNILKYEVHFRGDKKIILVIYPKTPTRVRFEIRYTKSLKSIFSTKVDPALTDELLIDALVDIAMRDAAKRVQKFVRELMRNIDMERVVLTPSRFLNLTNAINEVAGNHRFMAIQIIDLLASVGSVVIPPGKRVLREAMERLAKRGYVRRVSGQGRNVIYQLTEAYCGLQRAFNSIAA